MIRRGPIWAVIHTTDDPHAREAVQLAARHLLVHQHEHPGSRTPDEIRDILLGTGWATALTVPASTH